jgi:hypothetical protein
VRLLTTVRGTEVSTLSELHEFFSQEEQPLAIRFPGKVRIMVGDDVEVAGFRAGEVEALLDKNGNVLPWIGGEVEAVRIRFYDSQRVTLHADASARLVLIPLAATWVVQTLFTSEKIPKIAEEWNRTMLIHREEIFAVLTPIMRDVIIDLERHVETELPAFLKRHAGKIKALGDRMQSPLEGKQFASLFEKTIWPIAQPKVRPIIEDISREVWGKLPVWGLIWRLAYQHLPLTRDDHLKQAWVTFLEGQVVPIFLSHSEEILETAHDVAREVFEKKEVRETLRQAFAGLIRKPGFHELFQIFLQEVILDNPRFHETMLRRWSTPEVQRAVAAASTHIEPMVRRMGNIILGTRKEGITPEFARVLRSQILLKDGQRIVIDPGSKIAPALTRTSLEAHIELELKD